MIKSIGVQEISLSSFCDWPGCISHVIYIGSEDKNIYGCNWKCPTCHNKSLSWQPTGKANINIQYIIEKLNLHKKYINKITITGGEPTLCPNLYNLIKELNQNSFNKICIHSNGSNLNSIKELIDSIELFCIDIKGPFKKYPELTGIKNMSIDKISNTILDLLNFAKKYKEKFYFRTTKVPILTNDDLIETEKLVNSFNFPLHLQEYRNIK